MIYAEFADVFGLHTANARVFSAYGPDSRRQVMLDIVHKALTQPEVRLRGTGQESRDFIHAHDIALALEMMLERAPMQGESYNIANGEQTAISTLSHMILNALGLNLPMRASGLAQPGTPLNWQADITRLSVLGYAPKIPLKEGPRSFTAWCREETE